MASPIKAAPESNLQASSRSPVHRNRGSLACLERALKSQFSEEDMKFEEDNLEDILKLAEKQDLMKTSRNDLLKRMTTLTHKPQNPDQESENKDSQELPNNEGELKDTDEVSSVKNDVQTPLNALESSPEKEISKHEEKEMSCPDMSDELEDVLDERAGDEQPASFMPKPMIPPVPFSQTIAKKELHSSTHNKPGINFKNPFKSQSHKAPVILPGLEGTLKKKSTNLLKTWQRRYFVLANRRLFYYQTEAKETLSGCLDFDLISVKLEISNEKKQFKIIPVGGPRAFTLRAESEEETKKWFEALEKHVQASKGHTKVLPKVVSIKKYWKYQMISEEKFLREADTGDILLFRTKNFGAKLQRSFTRSEYDHVALLLKYANGELVLFEATSKTGVGLCRWSTFMKSKWHLLYSKMAFRKLQVKKGEDVISGIEKFVRYSVGKKYNVSAKKLLKKKSSIGDEESKDNRTFFCSELAAACYKSIDLLPKEISAASYFPGSFSAEKKLEWMNGAKLGDENRINFEI